MKISLVRGLDRTVYCARIMLSDAERAVMTTFNAIPMMYAPGGHGPDRPAAGSNVITFGFVRHSDAARGERDLRSCLDQFRKAVATEIKRRRDQSQRSAICAAAFDAGFEAFPAGRFMDAMRGTKSYPNHPRCPFRSEPKVSCWNAGYADAHQSIRAA
jgi:hypothetical protein